MNYLPYTNADFLFSISRLPVKYIYIHVKSVFAQKAAIQNPYNNPAKPITFEIDAVVLWDKMLYVKLYTLTAHKIFLQYLM